MVNVRLVTIGKLPPEMNVKEVLRWKSDLFRVLPEVSNYPINLTPDWGDWGYSDNNFRLNLPTEEEITLQTKDNKKADLTIYLMDTLIEGNWFSCIFDKNRIVVTFYQAKRILRSEHIPFENYMITHLYFYSLLSMKKGGVSIEMPDELSMVHGARRGCIFDMCGIKEELPDSCLKPVLCNSCKNKLKNIDEGLLAKIEKELKGLRRGRYYQAAQFLKIHPFLSLCASMLLALICGMLANFCYDEFFRCWTK